jgi:hypothetical protein
MALEPNTERPDIAVPYIYTFAGHVVGVFLEGTLGSPAAFACIAVEAAL